MARKKKQFLKVVVKAPKKLPPTKQSKKALKPVMKAAPVAVVPATPEQRKEVASAKTAGQSTPENPAPTRAGGKYKVVVMRAETKVPDSPEKKAAGAVKSEPAGAVKPEPAGAAKAEPGTMPVSAVIIGPGRNRMQSGSRSVQCLDCFLHVPTWDDLNKHKQVCAKRSINRIFTCYTCGTCFCTRQELNNHRRAKHLRLAVSPEQRRILQQQSSSLKSKGYNVVRLPKGVNPEEAFTKALGLKPAKVVMNKVAPKSLTIATPASSISKKVTGEGTTVISVVSSPPKKGAQSRQAPKTKAEAEEPQKVAAAASSPATAEKATPAAEEASPAKTRGQRHEAEEEVTVPPVATRRSSRRAETKLSGQQAEEKVADDGHPKKSLRSAAGKRSDKVSGQEKNEKAEEKVADAGSPKRSLRSAAGKGSGKASGQEKNEKAEEKVADAGSPKKSLRSAARKGAEKVTDAGTETPKKSSSAGKAQEKAEGKDAEPAGGSPRKSSRSAGSDKAAAAAVVPKTEEPATVKRSARVQARAAAGTVVAPWRSLLSNPKKDEPELKNVADKTGKETSQPTGKASPQKTAKVLADVHKFISKQVPQGSAKQVKTEAETPITPQSPRRRKRDESADKLHEDSQPEPAAAKKLKTSSDSQDEKPSKYVLGQVCVVKIGNKPPVNLTPGNPGRIRQTSQITSAKRPNSGDAEAGPSKLVKTDEQSAAICIPNRKVNWVAGADSTEEKVPPKLNMIPCLACGLRFQSAPALAAHRRYRCKVTLMEEAGRVHVCECGLKFSTAADLQKHNETEKQEGRYPRSEKNRARMFCSCLDCGQQFHRSQLAAHKRECSALLNIYTKVYACQHCSSCKTSSVQQLRQHIMAYHPHAPVPTIPQEILPAATEPENPVKKKKQPKMCLDCGETFPHEEFKEHKRSGCKQEGKSKIYSCFECHKMFTTRRELEAHKKAVHFVAGAAYMCGWCRESFHLYIDLRQHYEQKHSRVVRVPQDQIDSYLLNFQASNKRSFPVMPFPPKPVALSESEAVNFTSHVPGVGGAHGFQISIDTSSPGGPAVRVNRTVAEAAEAAAAPTVPSKLMQSERSFLQELKSKKAEGSKPSAAGEAEAAKAQLLKQAKLLKAKEAKEEEERRNKHRPAILRRRTTRAGGKSTSLESSLCKGPMKKVQMQPAATTSKEGEKGFVAVPTLPGVRMLVPVGNNQMVCLQCQSKLESVQDIASHKCPQMGKKVMVKSEGSSPEKKEWNLEPVPAVKDEEKGQTDEEEEGDDVEWFVASM